MGDSTRTTSLNALQVALGDGALSELDHLPQPGCGPPGAGVVGPERAASSVMTNRHYFKRLSIFH